MVTQRKVKTREQVQAERLAEIDAMQQMQLRRQAEQAERQKEHDEFARRVTAARNAHDAARHRLEMEQEDRPMTEAQYAQRREQIEQQARDLLAEAKPTIPTLDQLYQAQREQELAAEAEAEAARLAALTPRDIWFSALSWPARQKVIAYQTIHKTPWPMELPVPQ